MKKWIQLFAQVDNGACVALVEEVLMLEEGIPCEIDESISSHDDCMVHSDAI
jgi:hypothetical protein